MPLAILFPVSADPSFIRRGLGVFILPVAIFMMVGMMVGDRYAGKRRVLAGAATGSGAEAIILRAGSV